jgi:hypothetical protein
MERIDDASYLARGELARRLCLVRELVPGVRDVARLEGRVVALTDWDARIEVDLATGAIREGGAVAAQVNRRVLRAVRLCWEGVLADVGMAAGEGA